MSIWFLERCNYEYSLKVCYYVFTLLKFHLHRWNYSITILSTYVFKGLPAQGIFTIICFTSIPTIFGFYSVLYYPDYIFLISGFIYVRDTKEFAQVTPLPYLIILNSLHNGSSSDQNRARTERRRTSSLFYFLLQMSKSICITFDLLLEIFLKLQIWMLLHGVLVSLWLKK